MECQTSLPMTVFVWEERGQAACRRAGERRAASQLLRRLTSWGKLSSLARPDPKMKGTGCSSFCVRLLPILWNTLGFIPFSKTKQKQRKHTFLSSNSSDVLSASQVTGKAAAVYLWFACLQSPAVDWRIPDSLFVTWPIAFSRSLAEVYWKWVNV